MQACGRLRQQRRPPVGCLGRVNRVSGCRDERQPDNADQSTNSHPGTKSFLPLNLSAPRRRPARSSEARIATTRSTTTILCRRGRVQSNLTPRCRTRSGSSPTAIRPPRQREEAQAKGILDTSQRSKAADVPSSDWPLPVTGSRALPLHRRSSASGYYRSEPVPSSVLRPAFRRPLRASFDQSVSYPQALKYGGIPRTSENRFDRISWIDSSRLVKPNHNFLSPADRATWWRSPGMGWRSIASPAGRTPFFSLIVA